MNRFFVGSLGPEGSTVYVLHVPGQEGASTVAHSHSNVE